MKRIIKKLFLVFVLAVFMIGPAACTDTASVTQDSPAGSYELTKVRIADEELEAVNSGISGSLVLNEDGTGILTVMGGETEVTWDSAKKTISTGSIEDSYEYKDGVLEWTMEDTVQIFEKIEQESGE